MSDLVFFWNFLLRALLSLVHHTGCLCRCRHEVAAVFWSVQPDWEDLPPCPVYINEKGLFLFVNQKGAWSVNDLVNELGLLRGTGIGKDGNCVASVTDWALWDIHDWRSANITVSCIQDTRDMADMSPLQSHQSNRMSIIEEEGLPYSPGNLHFRLALGIVVLLYCTPLNQIE